jgi:CheY-like chemotaxis protein
MTDVQLKRLFRPFQQADASTNRRFGGTGLGLAISRPLAQALGGDLEAKSAPGRGSTFMLRAKIEVRPGTASTTTLEVLPEATHRPTGDLPVLGGRVLLAEDGEDNRLLLSTLLGRLGLTVRVAENGQAAVEAVTAAEAAGEPFNLIFMDMQMPVLDGYGATAALRERGFTGPIVALTAGAMAGERERCLAVGCDDYHSKPIDRVTLATVARRHLRADAAPGRPLLSTLAHDPEMAELIHIFVGGLEQRVSALLAASHSGDHDALHTLAHQLKGAAGGYGYPTITEAAGALAQAITHGPEAAIARQFDHLVALCRQALAAQA